MTAVDVPEAKDRVLEHLQPVSAGREKPFGLAGVYLAS